MYIYIYIQLEEFCISYHHYVYLYTYIYIYIGGGGLQGIEVLSEFPGIRFCLRSEPKWWIQAVQSGREHNAMITFWLCSNEIWPYLVSTVGYGYWRRFEKAAPFANEDSQNLTYIYMFSLIPMLKYSGPGTYFLVCIVRAYLEIMFSELLICRGL